MDQNPTLDLISAFVKVMQLRAASGFGTDSSIEATIPQAAMEREARSQGMTVPQFVEHFEVVWHYGSFPGLYLIFQRKAEKNKGEAGGTAAG